MIVPLLWAMAIGFLISSVLQQTKISRSDETSSIPADEDERRREMEVGKERKVKGRSRSRKEEEYRGWRGEIGKKIKQ